MGLRQQIRQWVAGAALDLYEEFIRGNYKPKDQHEPPKSPTALSLRHLTDPAVKIAHISDLHFGRHYEDKVVHLRRRLTELRPQFVVISGDLVDRPTEDNLRQARQFIDSLRSEFPNVLMVPGNHDRHGEIDLDRWRQELDVPHPFDCIIYELIDNRFMFFFLLNSTLAQLNGAEQWVHDLIQVRGWIDPIQIAWLRNIYEQLQKEYRAPYATGVKIAVLHHHLLPTRHSTFATEPFLNLGNAAELLDLLNDMRIDFVLHGHKHNPRMSVISTERQHHKIMVAGAGTATADSATKSNEREELKAQVSESTSFYLITLQPGSYSITQYNYSNAIERPQKFVPVRSPRYARERVPFTRFEVELVWRINFPSTDWEVEETHRIERVQDAPERSTYRFELSCTKAVDWGDLNVRCSRKINGHAVDDPRLREEPRRWEGSTVPGEVLYGFNPEYLLDPRLARGLDKDEIKITYTWPGGFFEFNHLSSVEDMWWYDWFVDRLDFTVEFQGMRQLTDFQVFSIADEEKIERNPQRGMYTATGLLPFTSINYKLVRD